MDMLHAFFTKLGITFDTAIIAFIGGTIKILVIGEKTPREAFLIYVTGLALGTLVGYSMEDLGYQHGHIYPAVAAVVLLSDNIVHALIKLGAALSKDPQAFISRWTGKGKQ